MKKMITGLKFGINELQIKKLIPCIFFFWIRSILYIILLIKIRDLFFNETNLDDLEEYKEIADDLLYLMNFNLFQLFATIKSTISNNIYSNYFTIVIMFHNFVFNTVTFLFGCFILSNNQENIVIRYCLVYGLASIIYFLEAIYALFNAYKDRYENNISLFKKIGLNKKINDAYASRKLLESYGPVCIFLASSIFFRNYVGFTFNKKISDFFETAYFIIILVEQLLIYTYFNEELIIKRKIVILVSFISQLIAIWIILSYSIFTDPRYPTIYYSTLFIFLDVFLVNSGLIYALIKDYKNFGSGYKDWKKKSRRFIDLSSDEKRKRKNKKRKH